MKLKCVSLLLAGMVGLGSSSWGEEDTPTASDAVSAVKKALVPGGGEGGLPEGLTWGALMEKASEGAPVWEEKELPEPEAATHSGVYSRIKMDERRSLWVIFKVAKDGAVALTQAGSGDDPDPQTDDAEEIMGGLTQIYKLKSGDPSGMAAMRAKAVEVKNLNSLKQICLGLHLYASDHGGQFPGDLSVLVGPDKTFEEKLTLTNPATGEEGIDPIYFPGFTNSSKADTIVLANPFPNPDGKRSAARVDGSVISMPEDEYQAQVKAQKGEEKE